MADFTPTQGRYLAFIHAYTNMHGCPPAESEIAVAMCVAPPSVNMMVRMLEKKGLISRRPGQPRSIEVIIPEEEIPPWNNRKMQTQKPVVRAKPAMPARKTEPANMYVLMVSLLGGPITEKFANKHISRTIEIRGDQTLEQLHETIFEAFDRSEQHLYEFQFGKRAYDPKGPNYGIADDAPMENYGDARTTKLDDLGLKVGRVFGYVFDFGDDWFHHVQVMRIDQAIPTVTYPRLIKRVGKAPPQYSEELH